MTATSPNPNNGGARVFYEQLVRLGMPTLLLALLLTTGWLWQDHNRVSLEQARSSSTLVAVQQLPIDMTQFRAELTQARIEIAQLRADLRNLSDRVDRSSDAQRRSVP